LVGNVGLVAIEPSPEFVPGDVLNLKVTDADLNLDNDALDTVDVVVENRGDNDTVKETETVTLTETGNATGIFVGTLPTDHGAFDPDGEGNNILFTDHGEVVQVTYVDANPEATISAQTTAVPGHDGSVQFTAPVYPGSDILIQVDDLDLTADTIDVTLENQTTGELETVTLFQSPVAGQYVGSLPSSTDAADNADDSGTLVVAVGDVLVVTYTDAVRADGSLDQDQTDQVTVTATPVAGGGGGGGGCTTGNGNAVNPTLPAVLIAILGLGWLRQRRRSLRG
jgi:hypothetical protein